MQLPAMLEGESRKRLMQGALAGALATAFIGFNWGGWMLESTAKQTRAGYQRRACGSSRPDLRRQVSARSRRHSEPGRVQENQLLDAGFLHPEGRMGDVFGHEFAGPCGRARLCQSDRQLVGYRQSRA